MSTGLSSAQYLQANDQGIPDDLYAPEPLRKRENWTTGLTVLCLVFALIGVLGSVSAIYGASRLIANEPLVIKSKSNSRSSRARKMAALETKVNAAMQRAQKKYRPVLFFMEFAKFGLGAAFLVAAGMILVRRRKGRSFAFAICGLAIAYNCCGSGVYVLVANSAKGGLQEMTSTIMTELRGDMRSHGQRMSKEQEKAVANMVANGAATGALLAGFLALLIKVGFYSATMLYLNRPNIREIFGENAFAGVAMQT